MTILIISNGKSALEKAKKIENYYGIESISGEELYKTGLKQAERLKIIPKDNIKATIFLFIIIPLFFFYNYIIIYFIKKIKVEFLTQPLKIIYLPNRTHHP